MSEEIKRVEVVINGETYILKGTGSQERMEILASSLSNRIREIQNRNPRLSTHQSAILTALNILDEHMKVQEEHRSLVELLEEEPREKG